MTTGPSGGSATALVVIDLQRAFCLDEGSVAQQGQDISACTAAAKACGPLVAACRTAGVPVVWTRMMFRDDYADGGVLVHTLRPGMKQIGALRAGTEDVELIPGLDVRDEDFIVDKPRFSAFIGTNFELVLRQLGASRLIVCGVTTSMCVESTVRDASQRDYDVFVVEDACAELDAARHEAALTAMGFGFARIVDSEEALSMLANASPRA